MNVCCFAIGAALVISLIPMAYAQQMDWSPLEADAEPPARRSHAMAYDQGNNVIVVFGGYGNGSHLSDTWVLDMKTKSWKNMEPAGSPSPRAATTMVYANSIGQTILFGGFGLGHSVVSNETWAYDYANNTWELVETRVAPSQRASYGMALDSKRDEIVLFGGFTELGYFNDLWVYKISEKEWLEIEQSGTLPAHRGAMSFVYDTRNDAFVMFGGFSAEGFFSDTWTLDAESKAWTEVQAQSSPPPTRSRMVYDERAGISILFGGDTIPSEGHQGSPIPYDKTWAYNYSEKNWAEISTSGKPSPRGLNGIAYETESGSVVIFGGTDTLIDDTNFVGNEFQDTWILSPETKEDGLGIEVPLIIAGIGGAIAAAAVAGIKKRKTVAK
jgi:N-acetylneuraminic acid mutarotase